VVFEAFTRLIKEYRKDPDSFWLESDLKVHLWQCLHECLGKRFRVHTEGEVQENRRKHADVVIISKKREESWNAYAERGEKRWEPYDAVIEVKYFGKRTGRKVRQRSEPTELDHRWVENDLKKLEYMKNEKKAKRAYLLIIDYHKKLGEENLGIPEFPKELRRKSQSPNLRGVNIIQFPSSEGLLEEQNASRYLNGRQYTVPLGD